MKIQFAGQFNRASNHSGSVLERGDQGLSESVVQYCIMCFETRVSGSQKHLKIQMYGIVF